MRHKEANGDLSAASALWPGQWPWGVSSHYTAPCLGRMGRAEVRVFGRRSDWKQDRDTAHAICKDTDCHAWLAFQKAGNSLRATESLLFCVAALPCTSTQSTASSHTAKWQMVGRLFRVLAVHLGLSTIVPNTLRLLGAWSSLLMNGVGSILSLLLPPDDHNCSWERKWVGFRTCSLVVLSHSSGCRQPWLAHGFAAHPRLRMN